MEKKSKKELRLEIEKANWIIKCLEQELKDIEDFYKRNAPDAVCPKCGERGLDCCGYQG